jgi:hypothetical protein
LLNYHTDGGNTDPSVILLSAIIEGEFTPKQALVYSRWLRDFFNLPLAI